LVGVMLSEGDGHRADLVSMWTAPESRRLGVGRMLVEAASGWARERGLVGLRLMVVSNNLGAIGFYERLGFRASGVVEVYPNDVSLTEVEMVLAISR
jgi:ribosomal protein S18 acetylase RimI-like enzyme